MCMSHPLARPCTCPPRTHRTRHRPSQCSLCCTRSPPPRRLSPGSLNARGKKHTPGWLTQSTFQPHTSCRRLTPPRPDQNTCRPGTGCTWPSHAPPCTCPPHTRYMRPSPRPCSLRCTCSLPPGCLSPGTGSWQDTTSTEICLRTSMCQQDTDCMDRQ